MAKWQIQQDMGYSNPVCYDAGNIEKINLDKTGRSESIIDNFICNGVQYNTAYKPTVSLYFGEVLFIPRDEKGNRIHVGTKFPKELPQNLTLVDGVYQDGNALCTDTRILHLCAMALWFYANNGYDKDITEKQLNAMLPKLTKGKSKAFLEKHHFPTTCLVSNSVDTNVQYANIERFLALKEDEL